MVDPFVRVALIMEWVTEERVKPLILISSLRVALTLQKIPLPDLSLGLVLRMGQVTDQQLISSLPGPDLRLV